MQCNGLLSKGNDRLSLLHTTNVRYECSTSDGNVRLRVNQCPQRQGESAVVTSKLNQPDVQI
jgi:hypothetical protein